MAAAAGAAAALAVMVLGPGALPPGGPGAVGAATGRDAALGTGCDRDGVRTSLRTAFSPSVGYVVNAVVVDGIDPGCAGHRLSVAVTGPSGAVSAQGGPVVVAPGGGEAAVAVPPVPAEAAARIHTLLD